MTQQIGARGCGTRKEGGVYIETALGPMGVPITEFLIDPAVYVDVDALRIGKQGITIAPDTTEVYRHVKALEADGRKPGQWETMYEARKLTQTWHAWDWIGSSHYPNVADFVQEVFHMGISRRIQKNAEFAKLGPNSRLVCLHERALIDNHFEYQQAIDREGTEYQAGTNRSAMTCIKGIREHEEFPCPVACSGLWWQDVEGGSLVLDPSVPPRAVVRTMPSFGYQAKHRPEGVVPKYRDAIFAIFPIGNLAVIRAEDGSHEAAVDAASQSGLLVTVEDA